MDKTRFSLYTLGYIIMALAVAASFGFQEYARRERVAQLNQINYHQCLEDEKLKRQFREEAREDYTKLDETLAFLRLEKTPAIVRRAKLDRDATLARFPALDCDPRLID